jgi:CRP/FNR family transcriptional regulator, cyclic AMP receptor protein
MMTLADVQIEKQGYLKDVDIFQDLSPEEVDILGQRAPMRQVAAGTIFYSPLEPTEVLFILKAGRVRLYRLSADGKALTTAILEAGTVFGEMALLGQGLTGSYAEAMSACVLCLMSRADVITLLLGDPRIAFRITEILGRRLIEAEQRWAEFAFHNLPERMAALLLRLAQETRPRFFGSSQIEVRYTHEQLAEMIGTHRETATKILNEFRAAGWVDLRRGKIIILDRAGLAGIRPH